MANGVKVGSGYIEITADVSKVVDDIKKGLNSVGTTAGTKVGKDIGEGIRKGAAPKDLGKTITADIQAGIGGKQVGERVGKDISASVKTTSKSELKGFMADALQPSLRDVKAWSDQVGAELRGGNIKAGLDDIGGAIKNTTDMLANAGDVFGLKFDALRSAGDLAAGALDAVGVKGDNLITKFAEVTDKGQVLGGQIHDTVKQVQDLGTAFGLAERNAPGKGSKVSGALEMIGAAAGPIGLTIAAGVEIDKWLTRMNVAKYTEVPGSALWFIHQLVNAGKDLKDLGARLGLPTGGQGFSSGPSSPQPLAPITPGMPPNLLPNQPGVPQIPGSTPYAAGPGSVIAPWLMKPSGATGASAAGSLPTAYTGPSPSGGGGGLRPVAGGVGNTGSRGAKDIVLATFAAAGYSDADLGKLDYIITHESNYDPTAKNPKTGDFGIFQFNPSGGAGTVTGNIATYLPDYSTDPQVQANAGVRYFKEHYGGNMDLAYRTKVNTGIYDDGGILQPGTTIAVNNTGEPELVVPPDVTAGAKAAGPAPAGGGDKNDPANQALDFMRTAGFIPATASNAGTVAGTSFVAGILNLGNQAVGGLIDMGASAAEAAISAAATAGSFGMGGQAAGPAAGVGIQIAATEAKRAVSYGFQLASIGADALIEQMFPFGAPRWLGYDYTQFLPQLNISQIGTTTIEKAIQAGLGKPGAAQPGGPVAPQQLPGAAPPGPPSPKFGEKTTIPPPEIPGTGPPAAGGPGAPPSPMGPPPAGAAPPPPMPALPPAPAAPGAGPPPANPLDVLASTFTADEGGWLPSGTAAFNQSGRPELVLSPMQLDQMSAAAPASSGGNVIIHNLNATDANDVGQQIARQQRLQMMRYSGRPGP